MKMYVPEIGDKIRLTKKWTFGLHHEYRNHELWEMLKCDEVPHIAAILAEQNRLSAEILTMESTFPPGAIYRYDQLTRAQHQAHSELREQLRMTYLHSKVVPVTLPAGTVLRLDRIYIRKGNSDYSSLTFYIVETKHPLLAPDPKVKGFKGGKKRFWAKLADVNRFEFDRVVEIVKPGAKS